jgi:hypothetical protein
MATSKEYLKIALGGNMNVSTLTPLAIEEIMTDFANKHYAEQLALCSVINRLLSEKIILALDDYGRSINRVEYGLPIDPDTKDFEDERPKEMLKIVTDILNGC